MKGRGLNETALGRVVDRSIDKSSVSSRLSSHPSSYFSYLTSHVFLLVPFYVTPSSSQFWLFLLTTVPVTPPLRPLLPYPLFRSNAPASPRFPTAAGGGGHCVVITPSTPH